MKNKEIPILSGIRLALQILLFILLPTLYIESLNGIKQIYLAILQQTFSAAIIPQLIAVLITIPITILFGRFFCGWMCGFGSFTDFIYLTFSKVFKRKKKVRINENADKWMKGIKYVVLLVLIAAIWSLNVSIFSTASPWDAFGMLVTIGKAPDFSYVIANLTAGFVILAAVLVASVFIERFFCRYLCPMGAIFAIASKLRIAKIKKPTAKCGNCRVCTNNCAMGIPLYKMDVVKTGECINCMKCVSACPRSNVSFAVAKEDVRPLIVGTATVAVMTGLYYAGNLTVNATGINTAAISSQSGQSVTANKQYKDGTYEGSGTGFRNGTTTVSVTIKDDKITAISTVSTNDDGPFYNQAYSTVTQEILNSQSANVDAVSGATFSSNGIMQAVEDALNKAKISNTVSSSVDQAVSSAASESSGSQSGTSSVASNKKSVDIFNAPDNSSSSASSTSSPASEASSKMASSTSGKYKDGTYQGSGTGFRGATTTVSVTVSGGKIAAIHVDSYGDDRPFFEQAYSGVSQEIISSQSVNVDAVSGATYSSNGIMQAVENALSKA